MARTHRPKAGTGVADRSGTPRVPGFGEEAPPFVADLLDPLGVLAVERVADAFGMSKFQLAETVGVARETLYKPSRARAPKTQARLREMLEIISRITAWAGGTLQAMAWYRAQPIPAFGGRTAESLVKSGHASAVRDYLDHIAMGGFA
jgi:uncharacterized protein (DUF2384 family)